LHGIKKVDFRVQRKVAHNNLQQGKTDHSYWPYLGDGKKNMGGFGAENIMEYGLSIRPPKAIAIKAAV
jgi:hypothetical protein